MTWTSSICRLLRKALLVSGFSCLGLSVMDWSILAAPSAGLAPWNGEFFEPKQGGLYVRVALKNFKASKQTRYITSDVFIEITEVLTKKVYSFAYKQQDLDAAPRDLFKLPSGKYIVNSIKIIDAFGVNRTWIGDSKHQFSIKRLCLSNLGIWEIQPVGADGLTVAFKPGVNTYVESGKKTDSSVVAVLDGFTGLIQAKLGGKKLLEAAATGYGGKNEMRASVTFTRQIAMSYRLDLLRHNYHAKAIAAVLSVHDTNMRTCYTRRLEFNDKLRGDVRFTFILAKQTGTMSRLKYTGGVANDPKLVECLYYELGQIQFPVPENMIGELTYTYDVR